jgi:hypothetical protein
VGNKTDGEPCDRVVEAVVKFRPMKSLCNEIGVFCLRNELRCSIGGVGWWSDGHGWQNPRGPDGAKGGRGRG